jgi:hypothetical protein
MPAAYKSRPRNVFTFMHNYERNATRPHAGSSWQVLQLKFWSSHSAIGYHHEESGCKEIFSNWFKPQSACKALQCCISCIFCHWHKRKSKLFNSFFIDCDSGFNSYLKWKFQLVNDENTSASGTLFLNLMEFPLPISGISSFKLCANYNRMSTSVLNRFMPYSDFQNYDKNWTVCCYAYKCL